MHMDEDDITIPGGFEQTLSKPLHFPRKIILDYQLINQKGQKQRLTMKQYC